MTLNAGTLNINNAAALGNVANAFVINGDTFDNTSGAAITTSNYTTAQQWNGDFTFGGSSPLNFGTSPVTLGSSRNVTVNSPALA